MPSKAHPFNVLLAPHDVRQLAELADLDRSSKGAVVRRLIGAAHRHQIEGLPTCADGTRCFVPQMHARPPAPPHPAERP